MTPLPLLLLTLAFLQPQAGGLTAEERALTAFIDADNDRALALLEKVVNINSGTMNFAGVRAAGALLRPEFDALWENQTTGTKPRRDSDCERYPYSNFPSRDAALRE